MTNAADTLVAVDLAEANGLLSHLTASQTELLDQARIALMAGDGTASHAVSLVLHRVLQIPVYAWARVERDFARIIAKAEARGLPVPVLTEVGRDARVVTAGILGGAPVFNGWSLVADLEQRTNKETGERSNIVRTAPGRACPVEYRDAPEQCLHCGLSRIRNRTFVIAHEDGRTTQVGSTCIDEYLGTEALSAWLSWSHLTDAVDDWAGLGGTWDDDEFARYRGDVSEWGLAVPVADFLAAICAEARVHGFASARSSATPNLATGRQVWAALQTATHEPVTTEDTARSVQVAEFLASLSGDSDFVHNLRTISGSDTVEWLDANTLAAAYTMHAREAARLNEHIPHAPVGTKVVLDLMITGMPYSVYEGEFGWVTKYYIKMVDSDGRTVVWPTTAPNNAVDGDGLAVGEKYRIVAKIKALGSFDGMAETTITARAAGLRAPGEVTKSAPVMRKWSAVGGFDCPAWAWTAAQRKRAAKAVAA